MSERPILFLLCGLPFSGKTTLACAMSERFGLVNVSVDRFAVGALTPSGEPEAKTWLEAYRLAIEEIRVALDAGCSVVLDAVGHHRRHRNRMRRLADRHGATMFVVHLDVSEAESRARMLANRARPTRPNVPDESFDQVAREMEPPDNGESVITYRSEDRLDDWLAREITPLTGVPTRIAPGSRVEAVVFDVGETLIDETRVWQSWADWLSVPRFTFIGVMGAVIERDEHFQRVFDEFWPGFDLAAEKRKREAAGFLRPFEVADLYPDVPDTFRALQEHGYRLAIAGNQPSTAEEILLELGLPVELVAASERWGVNKPSPEFFERLTAELDLPSDRIAYVGDRLDNDVLPALASGMVAVFLRRGPWGYVHARRPTAAQAHIRIDSLHELPHKLAEWNQATA